ncbi:MAG: fibrobacter succinogenes major paralogous domain-containing protein [Bacteroidales bacterium]|nr:fibrobacter succinogenes major paralogous domain-containing protein [Bacteroidales bacterium]
MKTLKIFLPLVLVCAVFYSCQKDENITVPVILTTDVTSITQITAISGGNISADGGATVTARGVCWDTAENPTINDDKTEDGTGVGSFTSNISGLEPNTTYYLRAYATNSEGTSYGQQEEFTTEESGQPGEGVTDIDGNFYPSVIIGNQMWMAENLKTTKYQNGTPIEYPGVNNTAWQNNTTGAYAWYNNEIDWKNSYGALYNWHAVNNSNGLCPAGWHVPSDAEWTELVNYAVAQGYPNNDEENGAANALKSCRQVSSPLGGDCATSNHPRWESSSPHYGTDKFGFSALPGGFRAATGYYLGIGAHGYWWSSTEFSTTEAWYRAMPLNYGNVIRSIYNNEEGYSVRCVRDEEI